MIRINLLASEAIKKEEKKELVALAYFLTAIVILTGLVKYGLKFNAYRLVENEIKLVDFELKKYESIVKQVEALQATKKVLETKKNVIDSLMIVRLVYPKFMEELIVSTPDNIWFKSLTTKLDAGTQISIKLGAEALDNYSIADFITTLSSNPNFLDVELGPISTIEKDKSETSSFDISFNYKREK